MGPTMAISAALRCERFCYLADLGTQTVEHLRHHVITLNKKPVIADLAGCVPVSDVPRQPVEVWTAYFQQRLWCCCDLDLATIGQNQNAPVIERGSLRQVGQNRAAVFGGQHLAPDKPVLIGQANGTGGRAMRVIVVFLSKSRGSHASPAAFTGDSRPT